MQGEESHSLEHAWVEEGGQGDAREGRAGDSAQSQIEAVKQVTGSSSNIPDPEEPVISRNLTKQSLCETG